MRKLQVLFTLLLVLAIGLLVWAEFELHSNRSGNHFDGQSGIGILFMLGIQYISLGVSVIVLVVEVSFFVYKKKLNQNAKVNIVVSIVAIVLAIFLISTFF